MYRIILTISFILIFSFAKAQYYNEDSCTKGKEENKEYNSKIEIIYNSIPESIIEPKMMLKTEPVKTNNQILFEELKNKNYSPKEVYFMVVAKELESVYNEMLT